MLKTDDDDDNNDDEGARWRKNRRRRRKRKGDFTIYPIRSHPPLIIAHLSLANGTYWSHLRQHLIAGKKLQGHRTPQLSTQLQ